jgi:hypothetical protein
MIRARRALIGIVLAAALALAPLIGGSSASAASLRPAAVAGSTTPTAASAAPCTYEWPAGLGSCTSQEPAVNLESLSEGDTSACSFAGTVAWGDGTQQTFTFAGAADGTVFHFASHTYQNVAKTYSISVTDAATGPCTWGDFTVSFTYSPGQTTQPSQCTKGYNEPTSWNTGESPSPVKGISKYDEPLNVIISACSTVPLGTIRSAMTDWDAALPTTLVTIRHATFDCVSPETANVTGLGYVTMNQAWRYEGCLEGNTLSVAGLENHVRFWAQPVAGHQNVAWFATASYETACVSVNGILYPFANEEGLLSPHFFHCIDGGKGSYDADGYNRGAKDFAHDVVLAAQQKDWKVTETTITRPVNSNPGKNVGEDGVQYNGTVYVLTVTKP